MTSKLTGVIFDMDGVISQTQSLHAQAQSEILEEMFGTKMNPPQITSKYAGKPPGEFFRVEGGASNPMRAYSEKQQRLHDLVEQQGVSPIPGALSLIDELSANYKMGVASSSEVKFIDMVLTSLGIRDQFDVVVSSSEVPNGKPAPDVFLEASNRLESLPETCLVIEDSVSGMRGASNAGMSVIGLVQDPSDSELDFTHDIVHTLETLSASKLEEVHSAAGVGVF